MSNIEEVQIALDTIARVLEDVHYMHDRVALYQDMPTTITLLDFMESVREDLEVIRWQVDRCSSAYND